MGYGEHEAYLGSDAFSLAPFTNRVQLISKTVMSRWSTGRTCTIYDETGKKVAAADSNVVSPGSAMVDKGNQRHFMAKEIHEQPEVVGHTLSRYLNGAALKVTVPDAARFADATKLTISACGTAFYAGMIGVLVREIGGDHGSRPTSPRVRYRFAGLSRRRDSALHFAIGRDGRHARRLARRQARRAARLGHRRVRESSIAREAGRRLADLCRAGNRRRLDQGLHLLGNRRCWRHWR